MVFRFFVVAMCMAIFLEASEQRAVLAAPTDSERIKRVVALLAAKHQRQEGADEQKILVVDLVQAVASRVVNATVSNNREGLVFCFPDFPGLQVKSPLLSKEHVSNIEFQDEIQAGFLSITLTVRGAPAYANYNKIRGLREA